MSGECDNCGQHGHGEANCPHVICKCTFPSAGCELCTVQYTHDNDTHAVVDLSKPLSEEDGFFVYRGGWIHFDPALALQKSSLTMKTNKDGYDRAYAALLILLAAIGIGIGGITYLMVTPL